MPKGNKKYTRHNLRSGKRVKPKTPKSPKRMGGGKGKPDNPKIENFRFPRDSGDRHLKRRQSSKSRTRLNVASKRRKR